MARDILNTMEEETDPAEFTANIDVLLKQHDISPTQQRRHIASILFAQPQHLSADQILERVNKENALASKATVYNTMGLFARKGLVNVVIVDPSRVFYDSNTKPHHHFYNQETGELLDIDNGQLELQNQPIPPQGTELGKIDIIVHIHPRGE